MRGRTEPATLLVIGRHGLRIECVDIGEVRVLRIDRQGYSELLVRSDVPIDLCVTVGRLDNPHVVGIRQRRHTHSVVSISQRLKQIQLSPLQRPRKRDVGRGAFDAVRSAVNPAETGNGIFEEATSIRPSPRAC